VEYCNERVCLSLRQHISTTTNPNFTKFYEHVACGRGSVFLWRLCNASYTSGFADDVVFSYYRPNGGVSVYTAATSPQVVHRLTALLRDIGWLFGVAVASFVA